VISWWVGTLVSCSRTAGLRGPGRHQPGIEKDKQNGPGRANHPAHSHGQIKGSPPPDRGAPLMIRGSPQALLVGFGLLLIVLVGALQGVNLWQEYQREQAVFRERLTAEVRLLAEHARLTFTSADMVLDQLERTLTRHDLEVLSSQHHYWEGLHGMVRRMPEFRGLSLADSEGQMLLTSW